MGGGTCREGPALPCALHGGAATTQPEGYKKQASPTSNVRENLILSLSSIREDLVCHPVVRQYGVHLVSRTQTLTEQFAEKQTSTLCNSKHQEV